jgi:predicted enzyme related to lactoylglutathione lyase
MKSETNTGALASAEMINFIATKDGAACRAFYEGKLGFSVKSDDAMAMILTMNGRSIRVQKLREFTPQSFTVLGWNVSDIESTVTGLERAGIRCEKLPGWKQDEHGIMDFPDTTRLAWFKDPDGNILSVAQMPR